MRRQNKGVRLMKQVKLIKLREKKRLTHQEVAESIGISRSFYTQIELGTRNPSINVLGKLSKFFNVKIDKIFLFADDTSSNMEIV